MSATPASSQHRGIIAYMASNHVAANLLMLTFLGGGFLTALTITQETYPTFELDYVNVRVSYPGASPQEVEEGITLAIEEEVRSLQAVERMTSTADEGSAEVQLELRDGYDANRALQEIKNAVDRITSFPEEAERPTIGLAVRSRYVMSLALYGDLDEASLFAYAERVRNELLSFPTITRVETWGGRRPEVSVEIGEETLRSLGLTLDDVARKIRLNARDVPAGGIRTDAGEVLLRTSGRRYFASEFEDIPLVSALDGSRVRLGDVAEVIEGFEDAKRINYFNGSPGIMVGVYQVDREKPLEIAQTVYDYIEDLKPTLPEGCGVEVLWNSADDYQERLDLLTTNGAIGLLLVVLVLGLFLAPRLAFWVAMGIPVSVLGSLLFLPSLGATINMISLFGFIITLGMVVDDAVIVGENIFYKMQQGVPSQEAAIQGCREMLLPILFAVGTNIVAFSPLLFVPGRTGKFFGMLPLIVISVFVVSLIECLFVLPAHLSHARLAAKSQAPDSFLARLGALLGIAAAGFEWFTEKVFVPFLDLSLRHRYFTVSIFLGALTLVGAYYQSGRVNFTFTPSVESSRVDGEVMVPFGAPFSEIKRVADTIERAGLRAAERLGGGKEVLAGRMNIIGRQAANRADVNFTLVSQEEREFTAGDFTRVWREEIGDLPGLESLYFEYEVGPSGSAAITIELAHPDRETLEHAATEMAGILENYTGVTDVNDGYAQGKPQFDFKIKPEGRSLGITASDLGRQVRHTYYGAEALRQQRGRSEVKVMVRLRREERESMLNFEELVIRTPSGGEVPLAQVAEVDAGAAYTEIDRVDGKRVLNITANIVPELVNVNKVREDLEAGPLPQMIVDHAGLSYSFEGRQRDERLALASLRKGLVLSLLIIFASIAAWFRSYLQGLVVMACIPFSVAAAVVGHILLGYDLSIVSIFGIIGLTGVAVNGALVLTVTMNNLVDSGLPFLTAVKEAGKRRFRPIMLTSATTFFGLTPMILETSVQARFLVPMAISIGFGVVCSSAVVLIQTLATHVIVNDFRMFFDNLSHGRFSFRERPRSGHGGEEIAAGTSVVD